MRTPRFTDFSTDFEKKTDCFAVYLFLPFEYQQPCAVPDPHHEIRGGEGRGGEGRGWGATPGSAANVLIQFLFFSFSSFDRFSYFRTLIIIMIIIINIRSFHAVSFLKDRADHFKVVGLKNLAVFRHLSCICSPSYLPAQQIQHKRPYVLYYPI